jgi:hypothetical protein
MSRSILLALIVVAFLGSCARTARESFGPICPAQGWAQKLAGDNQVDCGANHYGASDRQLQILGKCIARGMTSKRTVVFGYMASTPDSGFCAFAILSAESPAIVARYGYDYSAADGDVERGPQAFLGECQSVLVKKKSADPGLPFEADGCEFDKAAYDRVVGK